jgi:FAD/FMN-containing dehydrogenase
MQCAKQRGRGQGGILDRQMSDAHGCDDAGFNLAGISRRLANRVAATSKSIGSTRMPHASFLLAGSWGTLAVMTEVTLKMMPNAEAEGTFVLRGLDGVKH